MLRSDFGVKLILATRMDECASNGLATFEIEVSRDIWTEILTHRLAERNASSRRAMKGSRIIATHGAWIPEVFYKGIPSGMGDDNTLLPLDIQAIMREKWQETIDFVENKILEMEQLGGNKQQYNRLLTGAHITRGVLTMTEAGWRYFLNLRYRQGADRAMYELLAPKIAKQIEQANWTISDRHVPYYPYDLAGQGHTERDLIMIASARIARVSYGDTAGKDSDLSLAHRLINPPDGGPAHASPFGHHHFAKPAWDCAPCALNTFPDDEWSGYAWHPFRHDIEKGLV